MKREFVAFKCAKPRPAGKAAARRWRRRDPTRFLLRCLFGVAVLRPAGKAAGRRWRRREPTRFLLRCHFEVAVLRPAGKAAAGRWRRRDPTVFFSHATLSVPCLSQQRRHRDGAAGPKRPSPPYKHLIEDRPAEKALSQPSAHCGGSKLAASAPWRR